MATTALTGHAPAIQALAARWLRLLADDADGDFACSPAGLWLALAAIAAGARGETAEELRGLLGVAGSEAAPAVTEAVRALAATDALAVATGMWSAVPVEDGYRAALPDIGFGELDGSAGIHEWVRKATDGLIERAPAEPDPDTTLMLVNALALKARWEDPFDGLDTEDGQFTDADGGSRPVAMMSRKVALTDAWTVPDPFGGTTHVVELRCRAEAQGAVPARVRFVLGGRGRSPAGVLPAAWAPTGELQPLDVDEVRLVLPRLSLRTRLDVTPHLAGLGLAHCFGDLADLSGIGPAPLALGQVAQETVVKVAEEGIEAAAATAAMVWMGMARQHRVESIVFDRPFGIVVLDGTAEVPLFTAWQATTPVDPEGASYECLEGDDPNPASVRRVTFVPFLPDGRCAAVIGDGGELLLPSGDVLPGEDWRLDTAARVPLETAGYYRRRVRPFAYDAADQRVYAWLEGDRYRGRRPHAEPELFTDDPEAVAAILPYGPRRAVLDAARSYRARDDASYFADSARLLEPAYLRAATPEGGSGFGGGPEEWRACRSMIAEALHRDGTFLDIGCANGLLMESVRAWAAERGRSMEPYGIDIAPGLVGLARQRLPHWADRIETGNALDWQPADGRHFTFVHVLADCVPRARLGDLVRHTLTLVEPGGRLLVSVYQAVGGGDMSAAERLAGLGIAVAGSTTGDGPPGTATTAWVDA